MSNFLLIDSANSNIALCLTYRPLYSYITKQLQLARDPLYIDIQFLIYLLTLKDLLISYNYLLPPIKRRRNRNLSQNPIIQTIASIKTNYKSITNYKHVKTTLIISIKGKTVALGNIYKRSKKNLRLDSSFVTCYALIPTPLTLSHALTKYTSSISLNLKAITKKKTTLVAPLRHYLLILLPLLPLLNPQNKYYLQTLLQSNLLLKPWLIALISINLPLINY